jgi:hypothetical protein
MVRSTPELVEWSERSARRIGKNVPLGDAGWLVVDDAGEDGFLILRSLLVDKVSKRAAAGLLSLAKPCHIINLSGLA